MNENASRHWKSKSRVEAGQPNFRSKKTELKIKQVRCRHRCYFLLWAKKVWEISWNGLQMEWMTCLLNKGLYWRHEHMCWFNYTHSPFLQCRIAILHLLDSAMVGHGIVSFGGFFTICRVRVSRPHLKPQVLFLLVQVPHSLHWPTSQPSIGVKQKLNLENYDDDDDDDNENHW